MLCYAVRHAESTMNAGLDNEVDCGLTPLGRRQAEAIAERLGRTRIGAVYSSPYRRVLQTASVLAERAGVPVRLRGELCEFHSIVTDAVSEFVPRDLADVGREFPAAARDPDDGEPLDWPRPGESIRDVIARTRRFADFLRHRWDGPDDVAVVFSHGSPVARLIDAWLTDEPGPSFRFVIDNAALTALRCHESVRSLVCLNECSHLAGLPVPHVGNFQSDRVVRPTPPDHYW
ncbi:MAG: histidine phosphatase family protein [Phycisphaerae bacterium]